MKKQVRYGNQPTQKARLGPITEQQIQEIAALTGESKAEVVAAAITERHTRLVACHQEQELERLYQHIETLEAEIARLVNQ